MKVVPKITLESLALMIQTQFTEFGRRFDLLEVRISAVETRITSIENRLDKIEEGLDRIENIILTDHRNRLERLEDKIRVFETGKFKFT